MDKDQYETRLQTETIENGLRNTGMCMLAKVSLKLDYSPLAYLTGSIVSSSLKMSNNIKGSSGYAYDKLKKV